MKSRKTFNWRSYAALITLTQGAVKPYILNNADCVD